MGGRQTIVASCSKRKYSQEELEDRQVIINDYDMIK